MKESYQLARTQACINIYTDTYRGLGGGKSLVTEKVAHVSEEMVLGRVRDLWGGQHEAKPTQECSSPYPSSLPSYKLLTRSPHHLLLSPAPSKKKSLPFFFSQKKYSIFLSLCTLLFAPFEIRMSSMQFSLSDFGDVNVE
jgi:hypothetical protein